MTLRLSRTWSRDLITEVIYMGMTMTQKILAAHVGLDSVKAGGLINSINAKAA